jgi:hypothetical protein
LRGNLEDIDAVKESAESCYKEEKRLPEFGPQDCNMFLNGVFRFQGLPSRIGFWCFYDTIARWGRQGNFGRNGGLWIGRKLLLDARG